MLTMEYVNAKVGKYQNMEILEENIVDPCLLHDSKDCIVIEYESLSVSLFFRHHPHCPWHTLLKML